MDIINRKTYPSIEAWNAVSKIIEESVSTKTLTLMTFDEIITDTYFGKFLIGHRPSFSVNDGAGYQIIIRDNTVSSIVFGTRLNSFDSSRDVSDDPRYVEEDGVDGSTIFYVFISE